MRKKIAILFLLLLKVSLGQGPRLPWTKTNGPMGGWIEDICFNPKTTRIIYAGGKGGLFKTKNSGKKWIRIGPSFFNEGRIREIAIDPKKPNTVYILLDSTLNSDGIYKTSDSGKNWEKIQYLNSGKPNLIACDPFLSGILYTATTNGSLLFWNSKNKSWTNITPQKITKINNCEVLRAFDITKSGTIWVAFNDKQKAIGIFKSEDRGKTWEEIHFPILPYTRITSIKINKQNNNQVFVALEDTRNINLSQYLFVSYDSGKSWKPLFLEGRGRKPLVYVLGVFLGKYIFVSTGSDLWRSKDKGKTFQCISDTLRRVVHSGDIEKIASNPKKPAMLILPLRCGGIAVSYDFGSSWQPLNSGLDNVNIALLEPHPKKPNKIIAVSGLGEGTFITENYGESWKRVSLNGIYHPWADEIRYYKPNPNIVWQVADIGHVFESIDGGYNWKVKITDKKGFRYSSIYALALDPKDPKRIYAAKNGFGIFRSDNMGKSWNFLRFSPDYTYTIAVNPEKTNIVLSGYNRKRWENKAFIARSTDYGETWENALEGPYMGITDICFDKNNPKAGYAAAAGNEGAIFATENYGKYWKKIGNGFDFTSVHDIIIFPENPNIVFASVWDGGLWITKDGGNNWHQIKDAPLSISSLLFNKEKKYIFVVDRLKPIIMVSKDLGNTWKTFFEWEEKDYLIHSICIVKNSIYIALNKNKFSTGLFLRVDLDGKVKRKSSLPVSSVAKILIADKKKEKIIIASPFEGLYVSKNNGSLWQKLGQPPEVRITDALYLNKNNENIILISTIGENRENLGLPDTEKNILGRSGIYLSKDSGKHWVYAGFGGIKDKRVLSLKKYNGKIYACSESGVFVSSDFKNWEEISQNIGFKDSSSLAVLNDTIYLATRGAGVFKGKILNKEIKWTKTNGPKVKVVHVKIAVHPKNSNILFTSSYPGGFFVSFDRGNTWHQRNTASGSFLNLVGRVPEEESSMIKPITPKEDPDMLRYYPFSVNPENPDFILLGIYFSGLYYSTNMGETWRPVDTLNKKYKNISITDIKFNPNNPKEVFVASDKGIFLSKDSGYSWEEFNEGLLSYDIFSFSIGKDGNLYAGSRGYGLFIYDKPDKTWRQSISFDNNGVFWPVWERPLYQFTSILTDSRKPFTIYLGTFPAGIFKSTDFWKTFKEKNIGWTNDGDFCLVAHPTNPDIIFAGTYNGVNATFDGAEHWHPLDKGWPKEQWVFSIAFDWKNPNIVYACSKNGANKGRGTDEFKGTVMKSIDCGKTWFEITNGLNKQNEFYKIIVDKFDPNILYLATQWEGVFISRNGGLKWEPFNDGLLFKAAGNNENNVAEPLRLSADGKVLFFGTRFGGVWRTQIY